MKKDIEFIMELIRHKLEPKYYIRQIALRVGIFLSQGDNYLDLHIKLRDLTYGLKEYERGIHVLSLKIDMTNDTPIQELDWDNIFEINKEEIDRMFRYLNKRDHLIKENRKEV